MPSGSKPAFKVIKMLLRQNLLSVGAITATLPAAIKRIARRQSCYQGFALRQHRLARVAAWALTLTNL